MLKEIRCSEFESYGKKRPPIVFHDGLNTVLGGLAAENSIGKTTFLLIVDYCFGGESYAKDSTKDQIGNHTIEFAFEFDEKLYRFSRDVLSPRVVNVLDENWQLADTMKLADFTQFLQDHYRLNEMPPKSFRTTVGRFCRVAAKKNDSPDYPLSASPKEKISTVLDAIEKLFNLHHFVVELKTELKNVSETEKAIKSAQKYKLITNAVKTDNQYKKNQEAIEKLQEQIDQFVKESDAAELGREIEQSGEAAELRGRLSTLKREFRRLKSRHRTILANIEGNRRLQEGDLDELQSFFPEVNIEKVENVQRFHRDIYDILEEELKEEAEGIYALIQAADAEIQSIEAELQRMDETSQISPDFLARYSAYQEELAALKTQGEVYEQKQKAKAEVAENEKRLDEEEGSVLDKIQAMINSEVTRVSDLINDDVDPPAIRFEGRKNYTYWCPTDTGTGPSYKNLIILDLALLNITSLPVIVHDSTMFKNVADFPVDKIVELYSKYEGKQIIIAFDKQNSYSEKTKEILESSMILKLDEGGNELFGWSWKKKKKNRKK